MKKLTIIGIALSLLLGVGLWQQQHIVAAKAAPMFATFTVTNTLDSGTGSLRDAITLANAYPGADTITFSVNDPLISNAAGGTAGPSPTLGNYPNTSITLSSNTTITPSATPSNTTGIHVSTSTSFVGELMADPATGVVRITNAHHANIPPGTYTVTVEAFGPGGSTSTTFMLTVTNGVACGLGFVTGFTLPAMPEVAVGTLPTSVAIGDFNNDGIQDLAVANRDTSNVSILLGNGAGGFTAAVAVVVGTRPFSVAIGDFNNDGKQDFAVVNNSSDNVSIRLGDGAGGFISPATPEIPVGSLPISIAIGDFNGDGRLDFATANFASNNASIRLGDGAGGFTSPATPEITVGLVPQSVAIGDFNNDGKQDLAVANWNSGNISIRLGDGAGGFTSPAPAQVTVGSKPQSVAIGDFNNDGKQDLAVANSDSGNVSIRLGDGAGGFTSPATPEIPVGISPYLVAIGDFNNDGKQDFAAVNFDSGNVSIRLGDGAGGFTSPAVPELTVGSRPISVAIGDFNGDGIQDLAAANFSSNNVSIRLGGCSPATTTTITSDTPDPSVTGESIMVNFTVAARAPGMGTPTGSVTVSDGVNSCSGPLSAGAGSCMLSLFTAGARTLTASYPGDANFNGSSGMDSHTVNKASVTAAIISDLPDPSVIGQGVTVNYTATVTSPGSGTPTGNVLVTDGVNSCTGTPAAGQCVIALFTPGMRTLTATYQGDANYNASPPSAGAGHQVDKANTTTTVTVDNPDPAVGGNVVVTFSVVAAPPGSGTPTGDVVVTVSGGAETCTGTVASRTCTLALTSLGNRTLTAAYAGDTSYNGSSGTAGPSPTLGNYPNTSITLSSNTTITPSATPSNTTGIHVSTSTSFVGELMADPATGVVRITNAHHANIPPGTYTVTVKALGQGVSTPTSFMLTVTNGTACAFESGFISPTVPQITVGTLPTSVAIGDFNNDGIQDLAVANRDTSNVSILLGNGAGGFTAAVAVVVGTRPFSVAIGDFNNDGKQDFAVVNNSSDNVSIRLGDGAGGFISPATPEIPVGSLPISIAIGDFNGDGRLDFATANFASNNASIRLGDGAGGFTSPATPEITVGLVPQSVAIGDFNNDGKQDLAVANWNSGNISIRLGDGAGGFTSPAPAQVTVGSKPQSVAIGDFNNDGKQDLAVANSDSGNVSIRLGNGAGGFTSPATPEISVGTSPFSVAIGDFNNDGKQDFAVANFDSGNISIRLGDGAGGFTSPAVPELTVGSRPISVAIGDFNGDGIQDLAAANFFSNNVSIRLGQCNRSPTIAAATGLSRQQGSPASNSQIATVSDADQAANTLSVTVTPATGSGVTVGSPSIDGSGNVTASVSASCTATNSTFTLKVTDNQGAMATATLTVTVNPDNQPPTITCPDPVTHATDPNVCTAVVMFAAPTVGDNCSGVGTPVCAPASGATFPKGVTTVTCTVTDASNNSANCSFTVTVNDTQPPTITCPSPVVHATDPNVCTAVVTYANATAMDNCPGVGTPSCLPASGSTFNKGVTTVSCSASDLSSNTGTCSFTVTVNDTQPPQSCIAPPANMIGWWPGDGNANDIIGGNNGTLSGGATAVATGEVGQAFQFNGSTSVVTIGNPAALQLTGSITIDAWVNPSALGGAGTLQAVMTKWGQNFNQCGLGTLADSYGLYLQNNAGSLRVFSVIHQPPTSEPGVVGGTVPLGSFSHIAMTYESATGTYAIYVNGVSVGSTTAATGGICTSDTAVLIGRESSGIPRTFNGVIDEVEIFNRALTAAEIKSISDAGSFGKCKPVTVSTDPNVCTAVVNYSKPASVDNCDGARTVTCNPDTGTTFAKGVTTVTCMSSDTSSNTTTTTFAVTVKDTQAPTLTCPSNINVIGNVCQVETYTTPTGSDNCPGVMVSCAPASGTCFAVGTTTVTCTATDTSSNTGACSFTVTVTPCTITCPGNVVVPAEPGVCTAVATFADPTTTGSCGTVTCSPVSGSTFQKGVTTVTCSTTAGPSCAFTVTVNDTQPPMITCPGPISQSTDPNVCTAVVTFANPVVTDNCPPCNTVPPPGKPGQSPGSQAGCQVVCAPASGSTFNKGVTTVICTATDASNNQAMCSFTVTVNDTQPPSITCPANVTQSTDPNVCTAVVTYSNATATDNCPGVGTPVCSPASGTTFQKGVTTVSCTVSDASSNSSNCTFTVTINDTQPPTVTCPSPITQNTDPNVCTAVVTFADPVVTDNCPPCNGGGTKPGKGPQGTPPGGCSVACVPASGSTFQKGVTTVTCTATDASNNQAMCSFTVTVNDTQAPSITCPSPIAHATDPNACTAVVTFTPTATDNCPLGPTPIVCLPASGATFQKGVTTVSCTATDTSTNTANCSFTVTVNDTQAPAITCPANITQPVVAGQCSAVVTYSNATASDNCPGVGTPSCVPASGSTFQKGVTTVTCAVTDASSNNASCTFTVTVNDTQAPTITCPANVTKGTDPNVCNAVVTYPAPVVSDNCPGVGTPVCTPPSGSTFLKGVTTVFCTVSDASKNSANCTFTVTVNDTQNPTVICPANITFTTPGFNDPCGVVTYATPAGSDNCPLRPNPVSCTPASGTCFAVGMTTVTCTATDTSNNTGQCTFKITVQNPCTITCPANITKGNDPNQCGAVVTFAPTTTGGGCGTVACSPSSGSFFPKGTTTVLCTTAGPSCSFTVTVNDTQPPNITCPANIVHGTDPGVCQAVVTYPAPVVTDNCPGVGVPTCSPASGTIFPKGSTTVTCTVKDAVNNMSMCSFLVTVNDTQPPVFPNGCPAGITKAAQATCPITNTLLVTYTTPIATDNCGPAPTVVCNPPSGSTFPLGTTVVTCTATDSSGNTATCTFTVAVYSFCLQDDSSDGNVVFVNALTGDYLFCQNGVPLASGTGTVVMHGCNFQIDHTKGNRKVHIQGDTSANSGAGSGTAYIQKAGGGFVVQITDRRMAGDACTCSPGVPPPEPSK